MSRARPHSRPMREVAILLESSTSWGADALRGIAAFNHEHGPWLISVEPRGWYERLRLPPRWRGDGILARITSPAMLAEIERARVPAINLSYLNLNGSRTLQVTTDEVQLGRYAARYLIELGFSSFGYIGPPRYPHYIDRCGPAFAQVLAGAGYPCVTHRQSKTARTSQTWDFQQRQLGQWLLGLPRPAAIFAWNAERGRAIIDACRLSGLSTPDDVAVLSGLDDAVMCELSNPPLSAIDHDPKRIGYAAAAALSDMMEHGRVHPQPILFPPAGVITRRSTDVRMVDDAVMAAAIAFIRDHAQEPIQVEDVLREVPISRRLLEYRFAKLLGHSPAEEIRRVRLRRITHLLRTTDLPVARIAELCGFNHSEVLNRLFRQRLSTTPSAYRRAIRRGYPQPSL